MRGTQQRADARWMDSLASITVGSFRFAMSLRPEAGGLPARAAAGNLRREVLQRALAVSPSTPEVDGRSPQTEAIIRLCVFYFLVTCSIVPNGMPCALTKIAKCRGRVSPCAVHVPAVLSLPAPSNNLFSLSSSSEQTSPHYRQIHKQQSALTKRTHRAPKLKSEDTEGC